MFFKILNTYLSLCKAPSTAVTQFIVICRHFCHYLVSREAALGGFLRVFFPPGYHKNDFFSLLPFHSPYNFWHWENNPSAFQLKCWLKFPKTIFRVRYKNFYQTDFWTHTLRAVNADLCFHVQHKRWNMNLTRLCCACAVSSSLILQAPLQTRFPPLPNTIFLPWEM